MRRQAQKIRDALMQFDQKRLCENVSTIVVGLHIAGI